MYNQLTIIGYLGKDATSKQLPNGTPVIKFSVATEKSWQDQNDEWQQRTQWHNVVCFGANYDQMIGRLVKGALVFVQGELTTHEYDRKIKIGNGRNATEHSIKQLVVELKADTIRFLDRSPNSDGDAAEPEPTEAP
jgi:single-strand DNA-binding protein